MKRLNILLTLALLTPSLFTLSYATNICCAITINHSAQDQEERNVGSFKGITSGGSLTVKVTMGNKESVRLEGDAEAIADLITEVKSGVLTIRPKTKWSDWSRKYKRPNVTAYIHAKKITSLTMSGSGNMEVQNNINSNELVTTLSGSGSIKAIANVSSFTGIISGSGILDLTGKSEQSNLTLSGSGEFNGKRFAVSTLSVQVSGSANVYIAATKNIDAVISGSGNVYYTGNAKVSKTTIGSGRVQKM